MKFSRFPLIPVVMAWSCTPSGPDPTTVEVTPRPQALRMLTRVQFSNAVKDVFGSELVVPDVLPADARVDGLTAVASSKVALSPTAVERLERAAQAIASQVVANEAVRTRLVPCAAGPGDDTCLREAASTLGERAWRRPLTSAELDKLMARAKAFRDVKGDPWAGLEGVVSRLVQSPYFLYVAESGVDGKPTPYELATRLALFLTDTVPDAALLAAARDGSLSDDAVLRAQVDRLLATPAARKAMRRFFAEIYQIDHLASVQKDTNLFVHMSTDLMRSAEEQALGDLERLVFDKDADFRTFLTSAETQVDRRLAALYGLRAPSVEGFAPVTLPPARRGFLGQAAFLAVQSHPTSTSAVLRGKFIRTVLLCGNVPAPPVNVNTGLPEPSGNTRTLRERVKEHLAVESCRACHALMDPIGLGLEQFDALGGYRSTDNGATIDPTGDVDGTPFTDAASLGEVVVNHPEFAGCFVRHLYRHATAGRESDGEADLVASLTQSFVAGGHRVKPLISAIARSQALRTLGEVKP